VLFVQCRDARDMAGHYPPICYPAHGWTLDSSEAAVWNVAGKEITGTKYRLTLQRQGQSSTIIDYNFLLLPSGQIVPDMDKVIHASRDYLHHFYGAAQVQVIFDADIPAAEQDQIFNELISVYLPVINKVLAGEGK